MVQPRRKANRYGTGQMRTIPIGQGHPADPRRGPFNAAFNAALSPMGMFLDPPQLTELSGPTATAPPSAPTAIPGSVPIRGRSPGIEYRLPEVPTPSYEAPALKRLREEGWTPYLEMVREKDWFLGGPQGGGGQQPAGGNTFPVRLPPGPGGGNTFPVRLPAGPSGGNTFPVRLPTGPGGVDDSRNYNLRTFPVRLPTGGVGSPPAGMPPTGLPQVERNPYNGAPMLRRDYQAAMQGQRRFGSNEPTIMEGGAMHPRELRVRALIQNGMSPSEARRVVAQEVGPADIDWESARQATGVDYLGGQGGDANTTVQMPMFTRDGAASTGYSQDRERRLTTALSGQRAGVQGQLAAAAQTPAGQRVAQQAMLDLPPGAITAPGRGNMDTRLPSDTVARNSYAGPVQNVSQLPDGSFGSGLLTSGAAPQINHRAPWDMQRTPLSEIPDPEQIRGDTMKSDFTGTQGQSYDDLLEQRRANMLARREAERLSPEEAMRRQAGIEKGQARRGRIKMRRGPTTPEEMLQYSAARSPRSAAEYMRSQARGQQAAAELGLARDELDWKMGRADAEDQMNRVGQAEMAYQQWLATPEGMAADETARQAYRERLRGDYGVVSQVEPEQDDATVIEEGEVIPDRSGKLRRKANKGRAGRQQELGGGGGWSPYGDVKTTPPWNPPWLWNPQG